MLGLDPVDEPERIADPLAILPLELALLELGTAEETGEVSAPLSRPPIGLVESTPVTELTISAARRYVCAVLEEPEGTLIAPTIPAIQCFAVEQ